MGSVFLGFLLSIGLLAQEAATLPMSAPASMPAPGTGSIPGAVKEQRLPSSLAIGLQGRLRLQMVLQARLEGNPSAQSLRESAPTFRVRRAQLRIAGEMLPGRLSFLLMTDLARSLFKAGSDESGEPVLTPENPLSVRDAFLLFRTERTNLRAGQFKTLISLEGLDAITSVILPERALMPNVFGANRDMGLRLERERDLYRLYIALTNGSGENRVDTDNAKELSARLEYTPDYQGLYFLLALVGQQTIGASQSTIQLAEVDLRVERGPLLFQTEALYQSAEDGPEQRETFGWYMEGSYVHHRRLQFAARLGALNQDLSTKREALTRELWLGTSYFLVQDHQKESERYTQHPEYHQAKISLAYSSYQSLRASARSLTLGAQLAF